MPTLKRFNTQLPKSSDTKKNLQSNAWKNRVPKFPFHKDIAPTLIPKADTPRVGPSLSFKQLVYMLKSSTKSELLYMAESHRLYFLTSVALTVIVCYNLFDLLDRSIRSLIDEYKENPKDLDRRDNIVQAIQRGSLIGLMAGVYGLAAFVFATFPSRLVRRLEFVPGGPGGAKEYLRIVAHPWFPGRPSPVYTVPVENLSIAKRTKVWTGDGFYGTAHRSSFFFFMFEKGRRLPWIVDRSGWFWGDGRVYDVILGKENIDVAEKGLSYDKILKLEQHYQKRQEAELRRELGPAWRLKAMGKLVQEDAERLRNAAKRAVLSSGSDSTRQSLPKEDDKKSQNSKGGDEKL